MKKIFYFIASAIVALGAVACQNDIDENIDNNQQTEGLSIKVTIDEQTRVELGQLEDNKRKLTFTEGDVLVARANSQSGTNYLFECTKTEGDVYTFTCTAEGVSSLVGTKPWFFYLGGLHEQADELTIYGSVCNTAAEDLSGIGLSATGYEFDHNNKNLGEEGHMVSLHALPLLKFTANEPVTFQSTNRSQFFVNGWKDSYTTKKTGEIYLPIMTSGGECTVTVTTESGFNKTFTTMFEENKIYNLGTIEAPEALENWGIVGAHQGWATDNLDALYRVGNSNTYARYNMTFADGGFKFYGTTTEKVTVEHPAVTTGEEGDWYLKPNSNWNEANARFAIYFFGNGETWVSMKDENGDGIYVANNPTDGKNYPKMIFCRMNPNATANNWNNKWNQTGDLTKPTNGNNCFSVPSGSWDGATTGWSKHTPEVKDAWTEEVEEVTPYWIGKDASNDITKWVTRWSNNGGGDDIKVADTSKTYDVYFSLGEKQDWGFEIYYTVLEHGSPAPELK